jgi:hypothetical protein
METPGTEGAPSEGPTTPDEEGHEAVSGGETTEPSGAPETATGSELDEEGTES